MSGSSAPSAAAGAIAIKNDGSFMEQFKKLQAEKEKARLSNSASPAHAAPARSQSPGLAGSVSSSPRIGSPAVGGKKNEKLSAIERRKAMEERMRNRGKRKQQTETDGSASKRKLNPEEEQDAYLREVRKAESKSLKDAGSDVRSLVK